MKIITIWEKYNESKKEWEHNHISDGDEFELEFPKPKVCPSTGEEYESQKKSWSRGKWRSREGFISDDKEKTCEGFMLEEEWDEIRESLKKHTKKGTIELD